MKKRATFGKLPTLDEILAKQNLIQEALKNQKKIKLLFVHGSVAKGKTKPLSDLDIAVLFDGEYGLKDCSALLDELETILGTDNIDVAILDSASPLLWMQVLKNGVCLLGNEEAQFEFRLKTIKRYLSTKHLRTQFNRYVMDAIGGDS